jgi:periplasmic divalent cation tolerance protein
MKTRALFVVTAMPSLGVARKLVTAVLEARAAACVTILPAGESHYTWQGKRERSRERLVLFKLPARGYETLERLIRSLHPYECPEILAFPAVRGWAPYLTWLESSTGSPRKRKKAQK